MRTESNSAASIDVAWPPHAPIAAPDCPTCNIDPSIVEVLRREIRAQARYIAELQDQLEAMRDVAESTQYDVATAVQMTQGDEELAA